MGNENKFGETGFFLNGRNPLSRKTRALDAAKIYPRRQSTAVFRFIHAMRVDDNRIACPDNSISQHPENPLGSLNDDERGLFSLRFYER